MTWKPVAAVLLLVLAAGGGYWLFNGPAPQSQYRLAAVEKGPVVSTVSASGTVQPVLVVNVTPQAVGTLTQLLLDFNSEVKAGQPLAQLDPTNAQAQLAVARANLEVARSAVDINRAQVEHAKDDAENAQAQLDEAHTQVEHSVVAVAQSDRDFRRMRSLSSTGDVARSESEHAKAAYDSADSDVKAAKAREAGAGAALAAAQAGAQVAAAQLSNAVATVAAQEAALHLAEQDVDHTLIRAPIDGVVLQRNVVLGQTVAPTAAVPLFVIAQDLRNVQVHASVDEADIGRVAAGQAAMLSFDAYPETTFDGKVIDIRKTPQVAQSVVTYDVVVSVDNAALKLLPGMTADTRIIVNHSDDVVKVPNAALRVSAAALHLGAAANGRPAAEQGADTGQIWQLDAKGRPRLHTVRTGLTDGTFTEVIDGGIQPGQQVIVGVAPAASATRVGPLKF
jgi:HlyD family secretion protein